MMKYYVNRLKHDNLFWLSTALLIIFVNMEFVMFLKTQRPINGNYMTFLVSSSNGHIPQKIVIWLLPIYLVMGAAGWPARDAGSGYSEYLMTRTNSRKYFLETIVFVGLVESFRWFVIVLVNYLVAMAFFGRVPGMGPFDSSFLTDVTTAQQWPLLSWQLWHPVLGQLLFIVLSAMVVGVLAILIAAAGMVVKKMQVVFFVTMLFWLVLLTGNISITFLMQPYAEFTMRAALLGAGLLVVVTGAMLLIARRLVVHADIF